MHPSRITHLLKNKMVLAQLFDENINKYGEYVALVFEDKEFTNIQLLFLYQAEEIAYIVNDSNAETIITSNELLPR